MLIADIKGKLSLKEQYSEDFLTSSVFSVFKYIEVKHLKAFLSYAKNINGDSFKEDIKNADYDFWPMIKNDIKYGGGAEPDLVLKGDSWTIIVEAKNYSGKSGIGTSEELGNGDNNNFKLHDQLAREYFVGISKMGNKNNHKFYLVFLTRHDTFPKKDIEDTIESIEKIKSTKVINPRENIYWLNWQKAYLVFKAILENEQEGHFVKMIIDDILRFLEKRDIYAFSSFKFLCSSAKYDDFQNIKISKYLFYYIKDFNYWKFINLKDNLPDFKKTIFFKKTHPDYWLKITETNLLNYKYEKFYGKSKNQ